MESLPKVVIKKVPFLTASGDTVLIPGPWAIEQESSQARNHPLVTEEEDIEDADDIESVSAGDGESPTDRFVVRNEFGHVRIQPLVALLEESTEVGRLVPQTPALRVGGHCVLSPEDFEMCVSGGLGEKHPFAGRYHPIAGNLIPETTLLFYGPSTEEELESVWSLVRKSYEWVSGLAA